jgi:hypothetical protein
VKSWLTSTKRRRPWRVAGKSMSVKGEGGGPGYGRLWTDLVATYNLGAPRVSSLPLRSRRWRVLRQGRGAPQLKTALDTIEPPVDVVELPLHLADHVQDLVEPRIGLTIALVHEMSDVGFIGHGRSVVPAGRVVNRVVEGVEPASHRLEPRALPLCYPSSPIDSRAISIPVAIPPPRLNRFPFRLDSS